MKNGRATTAAQTEAGALYVKLQRKESYLRRLPAHFRRDDVPHRVHQHADARRDHRLRLGADRPAVRVRGLLRACAREGHEDNVRRGLDAAGRVPAVRAFAFDDPALRHAAAWSREQLLGINDSDVYGHQAASPIVQIMTFFPVRYLMLKGLLKNIDPSHGRSFAQHGREPLARVYHGCHAAAAAARASATRFLVSFIESVADFANPMHDRRRATIRWQPTIYLQHHRRHVRYHRRGGDGGRAAFADQHDACSSCRNTSWSARRPRR